ncbi:YitT family protein [Erysipelothrix tonsillarum]|uniref:YitT family protein n=1 Tax=Erysipelothrix tonsillarum TaxID=38402 RepID=UPI000375FCE9|nr:YitT family protein [Erysipelothrix tonsillarum]
MDRIKEHLSDLLFLLLGNFVLAIAVTFFILPNNILSGGVSGVSVALYPFLGIEKELMINIIYGTSFLLGLFFLGKRFAIKTLASTILSPLLINILSAIGYAPEIDPILASIFGGALMGIGLGLTFRTGASTGGMDIPPLILSKYTGIKVSVWIALIDTVTVLLGLKSYGLNNVLIGFLSIFTSAVAIDKVQMISGEQAKQVFIITNEVNEVLDRIHTMIDRGSTRIPATGGYTNESREIILTVLMKDQYVELERLVKEVDPNAFLIVSDATEVHGRGFMKAPIT